MDYWGQVWRRAYTSAGRLIETEDPLGQRVLYETDPMGRVVARKTLGPDDADLREIDRFTYDMNGNLVACENETVRVEMHFDADGHLVEERQGATFLVRDSFDEAGNHVARVTDLAGEIEHQQRVHFNYNAGSRLVSLDADRLASVRITREPSGVAVQEFLGAHLICNSSYSEDGLLTTCDLVTPVGTPLARNFEWDKLGRLTAWRDSVLGTQHLRYDALGRIIAFVDADGGTESVVLDPVGDRMTTVLVGPNNRDAPREWARVGCLDDAYHQFDRAGRLVCRIAKGVRTEYRWDALHRLVESRRDDQVTSYLYDAIGRRVAKKRGGEARHFFWSGSRMIGEIESGIDEDNTKRLYEWIYHEQTFVPAIVLIGTPSESGCACEPYYFINDPNGRPSRLVSGSGDVVWAATSRSWGEAVPKGVQLVRQPLRLQGQYEDEETGLHYNIFRYYDPRIGQFVSRDPLRLDAGSNLYWFAPNVWNWIDPLGLFPCHVQGIFPDTVTKGVHIDASNGIELKVLPDHLGGVTFKPVFSGESPAAVRSAIREATEDLAESPEFREKLYDTANRATGYLVGQGAPAKSGETAFLAKALSKVL